MVAYVIVMRERTKDANQRDLYTPLAKAASANHAMTVRALGGRHEEVEGAPFETVTVLEFPTYEAAQAWYKDPAYQEALRHREKAGDYRATIVEGL